MPTLISPERRLSAAPFAAGPSAGFSWQPALNAYGFPDYLLLCLDLAGADHGSLCVEATGQSLLISGERAPIQPVEGEPSHVLAMEIDQGSFRRTFNFSRPVDVDNAEMVSRGGLLWIRLPFRAD